MMISTEILLSLSDSRVSNSAASSFPAGHFWHLHISTNTIVGLEKNKKTQKTSKVLKCFCREVDQHIEALEILLPLSEPRIATAFKETVFSQES